MIRRADRDDVNAIMPQGLGEIRVEGDILQSRLRRPFLTTGEFTARNGHDLRVRVAFERLDVLTGHPAGTVDQYTQLLRLHGLRKVQQLFL